MKLEGYFLPVELNHIKPNQRIKLPYGILRGTFPISRKWLHITECSVHSLRLFVPAGPSSIESLYDLSLLYYTVFAFLFTAIYSHPMCLLVDRPIRSQKAGIWYVSGEVHDGQSLSWYFFVGYRSLTHSNILIRVVCLQFRFFPLHQMGGTAQKLFLLSWRCRVILALLKLVSRLRSCLVVLIRKFVGRPRTNFIFVFFELIRWNLVHIKLYLLYSYFFISK